MFTVHYTIIHCVLLKLKYKITIFWLFKTFISLLSFDYDFLFSSKHLVSPPPHINNCLLFLKLWNASLCSLKTPTHEKHERLSPSSSGHPGWRCTCCSREFLVHLSPGPLWSASPVCCSPAPACAPCPGKWPNGHLNSASGLSHCLSGPLRSQHWPLRTPLHQHPCRLSSPWRPRKRKGHHF